LKSYAETAQNLVTDLRIAISLCTRLPIGPAGAIVRGHEFHYATLLAPGSDEPLVELADAQGKAIGSDGGCRGWVTGTFFHAMAQKETD